jgi:8-oxo-dGTP pyrophosphatase MutT (NUDIX family)
MSYDLSPDVRARLLDELAEYVLDAPTELETVQRMYDFVGDEDADTTLEHVTASAVVVSSDGVLLHEHKQLQRWLQPGGHLDPGEHPAESARREVIEETGIVAEHWNGAPYLLTVDSHFIPETGHTHHDFRYLMTAPAVPPAPGEGESAAVRWFPMFEARDIADGSLRASIEKAIRIVLAGGMRTDA